MLKLGRVTKVTVFLLVLVYVFNIALFEFSAGIMEKSLLGSLVLFICEIIISILKKNRSFPIIPQIFNFTPLISRAHCP